MSRDLVDLVRFFGSELEFRNNDELGLGQPSISVTQSVLDIYVSRIVVIYFLTVLTKNCLLSSD